MATKSNPMTKAAASRIQSQEAKTNDGKVSNKSFASRAQRAADLNASKGGKNG